MSPAAVATAAPGGAGQDAPPPLDEVMLAMDVVDTLRRRERLVQQEFDQAGREQDLRDRLRRIYQAQGIEVPDRILDEGVAALKEDRFVYRMPAAGFAVRLARLYVNRGRWGKWLLGGLGVLLAGWAINYFVFIAPAAALPGELAGMHRETVQLAASEEARTRARRLMNAGEAALTEGDTAAARAALESLKTLRTTLGQEYSLRILNRPGERSGVWRVPDVNTQARNYYIIVEALDPSGRAIKVSVTNEETGQTESVSRWGLRVDRPTFEEVARDKADDGLIERDRFGYKPRGELTPTYERRTTGGAITAW